MELSLPPDLATTYTARETGPDDLDALYELVVADRTHFTGVCRVAKAMVGHWMAPGWTAVSAVVERAGGVEQWWHAAQEPGTASFHSSVTSRPGLEDVDALEAAAWDTVLRWAATVVPYPAAGILRTGRVLEDEAGQARLLRQGFAMTHTFWHMGGDVPDTVAPERHPPTAGPELEDHADQRAVHDLMQEAFREHYGYTPQAFDDAIVQYRERPGYDPTGWCLARLDGRPSGAMVLSWEQADRSALMVLELATRADVRGRGVATALLHKAFEVARAEGLQRVELFVDSQNTTGAPSLYRAVGLDVLGAMVQFERPLVGPGAQP